MRMSDAMEKPPKSMGLPKRRMAKKKKKIILSGMMVGPIDPKCWEPPEMYP